MHHATRPDPEMARRLRDLFENEGAIASNEDLKLGATGRYPEGKLTDRDEGEIRFAVGYVDGKVVIDFGQPVTWVGASPEQAKDLARSLLQYANPVTRPRGPSDG